VIASPLTRPGTILDSLIAALLCIPLIASGCSGKPKETIKVGVLHSLSGTMDISERSLVDATLLAIDEVNAAGGVLGRQIEPIVVDAESDLSKYASEATRLITVENVPVIFGCWTSASRKMVKPVVERYDRLLFYPVQYEGLEQSPNIVYTGAAPNQQIIPAVQWAFDHLGKRFFLVASDYVFPRAANEIIKAQLATLGGKVVGEEYLLLGSTKGVRKVVQTLVAAKPEVILNTINGDTNGVFFTELRRAGVTPEKIPTLSFSIAEDELRVLNLKDAGDYAAWNYFQSIQSEDNRTFVARFKERYGPKRVTDDPIEAAYFGVHLWAKAVTAAATLQTDAVRKALPGQRFQAPEGPVRIDGETQHTWKTVRVGRIKPDLQFEIVWTSESAIRPEPYPPYRAKADWERFLAELYTGWGRNWANPGS
jgi:urea transport system substrate-binding protein